MVLQMINMVTFLIEKRRYLSDNFGTWYGFISFCYFVTNLVRGLAAGSLLAYSYSIEGYLKFAEGKNNMFLKNVSMGLCFPCTTSMDINQSIDQQ